MIEIGIRHGMIDSPRTIQQRIIKTEGIFMWTGSKRLPTVFGVVGERA